LDRSCRHLEPECGETLARRLLVESGTELTLLPCRELTEPGEQRPVEELLVKPPDIALDAREFTVELGERVNGSEIAEPDGARQSAAPRVLGRDEVGAT
jgi:hypothetical protein